MFKKVIISIIVLLTTSFGGFAQTVFINEIHYDNTGADANEGVEIAGLAGTDLSCYTIYLYNGSGGANYTPTTILSGTIDDEGCGYGAVWFSISGIQNGNPDGIVLYNTCTSSVIQFISYGGTFTATNNVANGLGSTDIGVTEASGSAVGNSLQLGGTGTIYTDFTWAGSAANSMGNINPTQDFCNCVLSAEPTTNSSLLTFPNTTCSSILLNWTVGNGAKRMVVASLAPIVGTPTDQTNYNANAVFGSGATIAAGEFVVFNGAGNSVTVTGLAASTTYYFAIFEYNGTTINCTENYFLTGVLTGNTSTIACSAPICSEITGILVDACGGAIEGINEFFTFTNGNSNLYLDSLTATFPSGGSFCNSGCGAQNWTTNAVYTDSLNTWAGCAGLFVETDPIPANANVIVFTGASPTYTFDFSGLCGTGPYYAVFANNMSTGGRFANYQAGCGDFRTLTVDFGSTCLDTATYERCLLSSTDGAYVAYDAAGNPTYLNDGCTPTALLPIELLNFSGKPIGATNLLEWVTSTEINNNFFTIERAKDAIHFNPIGTIDGAGNSNIQLHYNFVDDSPTSGINYYRLKQTDFNGDYTHSSIIAINNELTDFSIFVNNNLLYIKLSTTDFIGKLVIYDITGRKIIESTINSNLKIDLSSYKKGIYIYRLISGNNSFSNKIILR